MASSPYLIGAGQSFALFLDFPVSCKSRDFPALPGVADLPSRAVCSTFVCPLLWGEGEDF